MPIAPAALTSAVRRSRGTTPSSSSRSRRKITWASPVTGAVRARNLRVFTSTVWTESGRAAAMASAMGAAVSGSSVEA